MELETRDLWRIVFLSEMGRKPSYALATNVIIL